MVLDANGHFRGASQGQVGWNCGTRQTVLNGPNWERSRTSIPGGQEAVMKSVSKRLLYWVPRIFTILFAMFVSVFALDVFTEHLPFWRLMLALFLHLIPTFVLLIALALAWRWEWIGGVVYFALGVFYLFSFGGRFPLTTYIVIAGPLFLIATLFALNWMLRKEMGVLQGRGVSELFSAAPARTGRRF